MTSGECSSPVILMDDMILRGCVGGKPFSQRPSLLIQFSFLKD